MLSEWKTFQIGNQIDLVETSSNLKCTGRDVLMMVEISHSSLQDQPKAELQTNSLV